VLVVEFEKKILLWAFFLKIGGIFFKMGAKNYFGIEKISFFGNYIDPWFKGFPKTFKK